MLFASIYTYRGTVTEESQKRLLNLFVNWKTPEGFTIKSQYSFADGSGGLVLIDAECEVAALEGTAPWIPFLEFRTIPIVEIEKAIPVFLAAAAWRDSVK
ncbi:MAG: hypothetical protein Q7T32_06390 [Moraxellaceae bacterium]|nr:hypothetical protein [Moraxellaceae bacterium]